MRISDWSSDVCSSDLRLGARLRLFGGRGAGRIARDIVLQLGALDVLIGLCRRHLRHPLGALALERIVPAGIKSQLAALQMQDVIDDTVPEIALTATDQDRRAIAFAEILANNHRS